MKQIRKRLTYANVMSSIAVFLVLGGATALAANQLAKNSVGPNQLKKSAVTTAKIKNDAVTGPKIKEQSLGAVPNASNASNAAALGGFPAADYLKTSGVQAFGAISSSTISGFTSKNFTPVIAKSFSVPANGLLFIVGSVTVADDGSIIGGNELYFRFRLDSTNVSNDNYYHGITAGNGGEELAQTGAGSAVIPVTAGAHTVFIDAREEGTGSYFFGRDLSILFVPGGSGVPIPVPGQF
ncbi:MAG TPA: hypothetical protein VF081_09990 [Solirubrobacterales bacterium]